MNGLINCLVVDDEPLAQALLEKHIKLIPELNLVTKCKSAMEAFTIINQQKIDLLFLDINMPVMSGIDFLKSVANRPAVILTTAYREYALESYEWDIIDYLLKPISFQRFLSAIDKYQGRGKKETNKIISSASEKGFIFVNENRKNVKVVLSEILYLESIKDYLRIHTSNSKILTKQTITQFASNLPSHFLRIHRSYVVNTKQIDAFSRNEIEIQGISLPIGISYKKDVAEVVNSLQ